MEKKLVEKYNWFRKKKNMDEKEKENKENKFMEKNSHGEDMIEKDMEMLKSILFVQHTPNSELARNIR